MLIHARFSPELLEWFKATQLPGIVRGILSEETGVKHEGLHYHCIWESDVGVESIKKRFQSGCKSLGLVVARGKANAWYGGVKEWSPDMAYAAKGGNIVSSPGVENAELQTLIAVGKERHSHKLVPPGTPLSLNAPVRPRLKAPTKEEQLIRYCVEKYGWTVGDQFHLYEDVQNTVQAHRALGLSAKVRHEQLYEPLIRKAVVSYCRGRCPDAAWSSMARNVFYTFADPWLRDDLEQWICSHKNIL